MENSSNYNSYTHAVFIVVIIANDKEDGIREFEWLVNEFWAMLGPTWPENDKKIIKSVAEMTEEWSGNVWFLTENLLKFTNALIEEK